MGDLSRSILVDCIEQILWGKSLVFWSLGVKLLDCGELNSVEGVQGISAHIFAGVVWGVS